MKNPAIAWCVQHELKDADSKAIVNNAAEFIVWMALKPLLASPSFYSNKDEVYEPHKHQGEQLFEARQYLSDLQGLAAETGVSWQPESIPAADETAVVGMYKTWKQWRNQLREAIQTHKDDEPEILCLAFNCWQCAERDTEKAKALAVDPSLGIQADIFGRWEHAPTRPTITISACRASSASSMATTRTASRAPLRWPTHLAAVREGKFHRPGRNRGAKMRSHEATEVRNREGEQERPARCRG